MSFWKKLKGGHSKTSQSLTQGIVAVFTHKKLDEATLDAFEDLLIQADMGVKIAAELRELLKKQQTKCLKNLVLTIPFYKSLKI